MALDCQSREYFGLLSVDEHIARRCGKNGDDQEDGDDGDHGDDHEHGENQDATRWRHCNALLMRLYGKTNKKQKRPGKSPGPAYR